MNRLQKKCILAAVGVHLLLVVIMIVGPAFLSSHENSDDTQVIDFIPANLIDKPFSGGGEKNPTPAASPTPVSQQTAAVQTPQPKAEVTPPTPQPKPVDQPKAVQPVAQKETTKPTPPKRDPDSLETKPAKAKPQVSTELVTRKASSTQTTKSADVAAAAAAAKQHASDVAKSIKNLRQGLSSATAVETPPGFGGGGEAYASYGLVVKSVYESAWIEPSDASADNATASVTVTIGNDGTVISAQLTTPSGDERTDASIQRALDHVKFIAPFPASMTEKQHTYIIDFNLKAKRSTA